MQAAVEKTTRGAVSSFCLALLVALPILTGVAPSFAERAVPVSCLYLRNPVEESAAKARGEESSLQLVPALRERIRGGAPDSLNVLVILIDWADQEARHESDPPSRYEKEFFQTTAAGNETMRDYYEEVSGGRFRLGGAVTVWLRSALPYTYYVNSDGTPGTADDYGFNTSDASFAATPYPANVWGIIREAALLADASGVDFSLFDSDGPDGVPSSGDDDGVVDALVVIHAGAGAERVFDPYLGPSQIWSHKSDMDDPAIEARMGSTVIDGVRLGAYDLVPEIGQTGVYAHEFGHILGLPDLYRTFTENGSTVQASTIGVFCLMDAGSLLPLHAGGGVPAGDSPSHLNPFFKSWLGWLEPHAYEAGAGFTGPITLHLDEIERGGPAVRLLSNPNGVDWDGGGGGTGEYFVLENRRQLGFDAALPGSGLLIWHVSERRPANESSDYAKRLLGLVETDGAPGDLGTETGQGGTNLGEEEDLWPFAGRTDWTPDTDPPSDLSGGAFSGVSVTGIREDGAVVACELDLEAVRPGAAYAYPNPWKPSDPAAPELTIKFRSPAGEGVQPPEVRIFDLGGNLVRTLDRGAEIAPDGEAVSCYWDGRNDAGLDVASGVYFYVVRKEGETEQGKIALMR